MTDHGKLPEVEAATPRGHRRTCPLCEAMCGLRLAVVGSEVTSVRGDPEDIFSRGHLCPKAHALADLQADPHRLREPLRKEGGSWRPVSWNAALDDAAERFVEIGRRHGRDAVAFYRGNPTLHSYAGQLAELELTKVLDSRSCFSTASMDHLPHLLAGYHLFGHQLLMPVPDVDRTDFFLVVGANPVVSNGSLMSAPGIAGRLRRLRERGGTLVVIDPRRTRTADLADRHLAPRPGTDAILLAAIARTLLEEDLVAPGRLAEWTDGIDRVAEAVAPFTPERAEAACGVAAAELRRLARDLAAAPSAVCYGRVGACTQEFGGLTVWLLTVLNVLTGNLDRPGGALFTRPAVDIVSIGSLLGQRGSFARYRSRVRGLPESGGELPVAVLAEEIDTPGEGRIRGLLTSAGNPVLSTPNGARLDRALPGLDFMVSIDFYLNETTRHADLVLPPPSPLERDHYDLGFRALAVRNTARYDPPLFPADEGVRPDWWIYLELARRLARARGGLGGKADAARMAFLARLGPRRELALLLRLGPHGLSLGRLENEGRTLDLGPLEPSLPQRLFTRDRRIRLAPRLYLDDMKRLEARTAELERRDGEQDDALLLIGRRQIRSNNSWMHGSRRLAHGAEGCTLRMHPGDAASRGLADGDRVDVRSRVGSVSLPVEFDDALAPGVVSIPHGYGHDRSGTRLGVPPERVGASLNDLTDEGRLDALTGTAAFSGVPVRVNLSREG